MSLNCRRTLIVTILLTALVGCAGVKADLHDPQAATADSVRLPPNQINESFDFKPRDETAYRHFTTPAQQTRSAAERLELSILNEMTGAETEKDLGKVFDRLWANEPLARKLVEENNLQPNENLQILVLLHYLLVAGDESSWRQEASAKIYRDSLVRITVNDLSGYSLHFHTLALLKTGRFARAMEFLKRLESVTDKAAYLIDLTIALEYALKGDDPNTATQLMVEICRTWGKNRGKFPDKDMQQAVIVLQRAGEIEPLRWTMTKIIKANPNLEGFAFTRLLFPGAVGQRDLDVTLSGQPTSSRQVLIKMQVILAGNDRVFIDPALAKLSGELQEPVSFSSLELIGDKSFVMAMGEKAELSLPEGFQLLIQPDRLESASSRLLVRIRKGLHEKLHILIESVHGGVTTLSGSNNQKGVTLLRITTYELDGNQS